MGMNEWHLLTAALAGVVTGGVGGAMVGGVISHRTKISEFRQAWINELRVDVAAYMGLSEKWVRRLWITNQGNRSESDANELARTANEAMVLLRRIRLRFNPRM